MFRKYFSRFLTASTLLVLALEPPVMSSLRQAPSTGSPTISPGGAAPALNRPLPFGPGEVLTYNVGFSKLVFSGSIGQLKLIVKSPAEPKKDSGSAQNSSTGRYQTESNGSKEPVKPQNQVSATTTPPGPQDHLSNIEFSAEVSSKGFFTWLFGIKIEDKYGAVVGSDDFGLLRSWKDIDQGDVHRHYETRVDRELGTVSYSESDRKSPGAPKVKTGSSPRWILDLLSAVYFIRTREFKEGTPMTLPVTDVGQVYTIDVVPVKREEVEVEAGKFKTVQLDLKIFDGRYIKRSGQLLVWLSDDARRLPVRARVKSSGTTVNINLARHEPAS